MRLDKDSDITNISSLTERELEIMSLISKGLSNAKIAEVLCLSMHTAKNHKENIKRKLGINSCPDLLQFAIKYSEYWQSEATIDEPQ
jgi:DNA-binding CsgD family transcriptional regulator